MNPHDVLSAVRRLAIAMARAEAELGPDRCSALQHAALADAVGGVAPLGLSARQMTSVAERLEVEALVHQLTRDPARPVEARA